MEMGIQYGLYELEHNGRVYIEIQKGMYSLKQAGILTNNKLTSHLAKYGYAPVVFTPGLWKHATKYVYFHVMCR